jgi:hypothetical protein
VPTIQMMPGGRGLDFPDGTSLKADHRGRVHVTDEQATAVKGSAAKRRYDAIIEVAPMRHSARPDEYICSCGYAPWPWQHECPRCGAVLKGV